MGERFLSSNFCGAIIEGIGLVKLRYGQHAENNMLAKRLARCSGGASGLLGKARGSREIHGGPVARNVAAVVVDLYNRRKRGNKLESWWK